MEKTRVPKGEKYWFIKTNDTYTGIRADWAIEGLSPFVDASRFECGNYFTTIEEAVAIASKLRAVLKGTEVIEMPSEEEIITKSEEIAEIDIDEAYMAAEDIANFFKSKIVK